MKQRDYYDVLGVGKDADAGTIKKSYRKLAKKYHPDMHPDDKDAEKVFKEITEAYNVLSDPEKKKLYDQFGFDGLAEGFNPEEYMRRQQAYRSGGHGFGGYQEYHFEGGNMDDILKDIFGHSHGGYGESFARDFSNGFGGFGSTRSRQNFRQKGSDLQADISISFDEAVTGCEKMIHLQATDGSATSSLQVHIPAGIDEGKTVRLRGKGNPGYGGGEAGDLLLKVHVGTKPGFERKGMDVYTTANIPFTTAVFGGEVTVQTLTGKVLCKIREGTQSGTKIRLRGKGIVSMKDTSVHGDQYVTVQIQVPKSLTPAERQALKNYAEVSENINYNRQGAA